MKYYVYVLRCSDRSYYTGVTNNVIRRLEEHNYGIDPYCYTYRRRPVQLVFHYGFGNATQAIAAEKQIKRWSRRKKEALIDDDFDQIALLARSQYKKRIDVMVRRAHHDICACYPELVGGWHATALASCST